MAENNSKTFDINRFIFTYGPLVISGLAPGTFVKVAFDSPLYVETEGSDGEVCRVLRPKYKATITLSLMQSSRFNTLLSAALEADVAGNLQEPLTIKDLNGDTVGVATQCWITKLPDASFADEAVPREWEIKAAKMKLIVGGNFA